MTTTSLGARWLGSPNFTPRRNGHTMAEQPAYVVMHTMVGTWESANQRFQNPRDPAQASATYGVLLDGSIVQWVDEDDAAGANGTFDRNPGSNLDSISIEHEDNGDYNGPRTPALYQTSARLVRDICSRYGIPIDRGHVLLHREVSIAPTDCPDSLDVDGIVRMAAGQEPLPGGTEVLDPNDPVVQDLKATIFQAASNIEHNLVTWLGAAEAKTDMDLKAIKIAPVDVEALAAALAPHIQQADEAKLAADLEAALPAPVAAAVRQALGAALSGG